MLKASEFAAKPLHSAADHKRATTTLRRLASGIEAQGGYAFDLSRKEREILVEAAQLLGQMADLTARVARLKKKTEEAAKARRKLIEAAVASTFGRLATIAERVAVIGAVDSQRLQRNAAEWVGSKHWLSVSFDSALCELVWKLGLSDAAQPVDQLVAEAWAKFQDGKAAIEAQHVGVIVAQQQLHGEQPVAI